jgi:iron complex outermembrane receptor protein
MDAALFYNDYNDMQVFVLVNPPASEQGAPPVNTLDNAKHAHTEGIEAQIVANPINPLTLSLQMGWLETKLDEYISNRAPDTPDYSGNQLPNSPHFSLAGLADYKLPIGPGVVDLQFSVTYKSHQFFDVVNDPYITQKEYWLENFRIAYQPAHAKWEIAAFGRNLSDEKYFMDKFDLTSPFGFIQGITGTPRTFGGEINYRF